MIFSIAIIAFVLAVGYIWASKGWFNALIQMVLVIVSGAVAFGVWETVADLLMDNVSEPWMQDLVWGAGLLAPFLLTLAVLSLLATAVLRANVKCENTVQWVGGGICGAVAATISAGILCLSIAQTKVGDEFLGYKAIRWDSGGSIVSKSGLLFPVDQITASLYGYLGDNVLSTGTPLAKWRPYMVEYANALNLQPSPDVSVRYTVKPTDVKVLGRFTIGQDDPQSKAGPLVGDNKPVYLLDGTQVPAGSAAYVEGYLLQFAAGAKEKSGQVSIGPGQFLLVLRNDADDTSLALNPIAIIAQAKGEFTIMGRFRFDAQDVFLGNAGNAADPKIMLEFLVPRDGQNWRPIALYAKGQRVAELIDTSVEPAADRFTPDKYADRADADRFVPDGSLVKSVLQTATAGLTGTGVKNPADALSSGNQLGKVRLNKSNLRGLEVNERNEVLDGQGKFLPNEMLERGSDRSLEVSRFYPGDRSLIMQVNVARGSALSMVDGDSADAPESGAIVLEDTAGQRFECIGFVYQETRLITVRFTPGAPLLKRDLPALSRSREDQVISLIFRVSDGVQIARYAIGDRVIATFDPPVKADAIAQRRR